MYFIKKNLIFKKSNLIINIVMLLNQSIQNNVDGHTITPMCFNIGHPWKLLGKKGIELLISILT